MSEDRDAAYRRWLDGWERIVPRAPTPERPPVAIDWQRVMARERWRRDRRPRRRPAS